MFLPVVCVAMATMAGTRELLDRRLRRVLVLLERLRAAGRERGCCGHMVFETGGRRAEAMLGDATEVVAGVAVLDWLRAPVAAAFFGCAEGDVLEVMAHGRTSSTRLVERSLLVLDDGGWLCALDTPLGGLVLRDGEWRLVPNGRSLAPARTGDGSGRRVPRADELDGLQRTAVKLPAGTPCLITGEAGSGKTTVALHRLAHLTRAKSAAFRSLVLLPSEPLRRLAESIVRTLCVRGCEVRSFDEWATEQARRAFPDLPERVSSDAPASVMGLKRHPALRHALSVLAASPPNQPDAEGAQRARRSNARATHADLEHLFGDRVLMERTAAASGGAINARAVAEVIEHTHVQFSPTAEQELCFVDPDRLRTLDGMSIDEGTPMEAADSIDAEDLPVLFELERLRAIAQGGPPVAVDRYDCVVIDEAQELAPLELLLAGRAVAPGGTLVVAGDEAQQVDPTAAFAGWADVMAALGASEPHRAVLDVGYRLAPALRRFTRAIVGRCGGQPPGTDDGTITRVRQPSEAHLLAWLVDELRRREQVAPETSIAVIFRDGEHMARLGAALRRVVTVRASDGDTEVRSGACITSVPQVKGLELDVVIVVDASASRYPDTAEARRALYVAATRARFELVLTSVGPWTPIIAVDNLGSGGEAAPP